MIASVNSAAVPALTIAGIFFLAVNVLAAVYIARHWQEFFGRDARTEGDRPATRYLQIIVITIPLLFLTGRLILTLVDLWRG